MKDGFSGGEHLGQPGSRAQVPQVLTFNGTDADSRLFAQKIQVGLIAEYNAPLRVNDVNAFPAWHPAQRGHPDSVPLIRPFLSAGALVQGRGPTHIVFHLTTQLYDTQNERAGQESAARVSPGASKGASVPGTI